MSDAKNESNIFTLSEPAELLFNADGIFEKHALEIDGRKTDREQWDMTVLMRADSADLAALKQLVVTVFRGKFPEIDISDKRNWQYPWEAGEDFIERGKAKARATGKEPPDNEFMLGHVLVKAHAVKYAPNISVLVPGRGVVDFRDDARLTAKDKFYPGCQVLAEYNVASHKVGTNKPGVTLYLNKVCSLNKGERRGGGRSGAETFGAYVGKMSAVDPTAGAESITY